MTDAYRMERIVYALKNSRKVLQEVVKPLILDCVYERKTKVRAEAAIHVINTVLTENEVQ